MSSYDTSKVPRVKYQNMDETSFPNYRIDWEDDNFNETRSIVDLSILTIGYFLNSLILLVILTKRQMHNSLGCYVISLSISNLVILLNVLDGVLLRWFAIEFEPDLDLVGRVTLQSHSLTLVMFSLEKYIVTCHRDSMWHKNATKLKTAVIGIVTIWCYASITSTMELNLYEHFSIKTVLNIFCWSTVVYLLLPGLVILFLDGLIIMEITEYREIATIKWSEKDIESLRLLIALTFNFYVTMVPQRIVTILYHKSPQICCSPLTMNICYYLGKVSTIVSPVIFLGTLKTLRRSIKEIVFCKR